MRPLSSLDAKGIRGVCFDIDDTLTTHGRLGEAAYSSLWQLRRAGFRLIAATGRPLGWTDVIARQWPVDGAVGENGAGFVWMSNEGLREGYIDSAEERGQQAGILQRLKSRISSALPSIQTSDDSHARRCDIAFDIGEKHTVPAEQIAELVAMIESEGCSAPVSSVHCHAVPGDWDKARGIAALHEAIWGEPLMREEWAFIGDSGNDAAAFSAFPISVGVANVRPHLERLGVRQPKFVCEKERGEGFSELAAHLLKART